MSIALERWLSHFAFQQNAEDFFFFVKRKRVSWTRRDIPRHAFSFLKKRPGVAKRNENYFIIMAHCLFFLAPRQGLKRTRLRTRPFEPATSCFFEKEFFSFRQRFLFVKRKGCCKAGALPLRYEPILVIFLGKPIVENTQLCNIPGWIERYENRVKTLLRFLLLLVFQN